ncbi:hypothetical protein [Streptomyces sp. NPDC088725]|uniref:hypothetical protein n=1 Tax=Streptomyces sp. NPDC088725 TaxID=3365873 RepID=UPI00382BD262
MSDTGASGTQGQPNPFLTDPGAGGNGFPPPPYLASSPEAKRKAAKSIDEHIEPDIRKGGVVADESTSTAVKAFGAKDGDGWVTSSGLKTAHATWSDQVKALLNRLASEKSALLATNTVLGGTDLQTGAGVKRIPSSFDGY